MIWPEMRLFNPEMNLLNTKMCLFKPEMSMLNTEISLFKPEMSLLNTEMSLLNPELSLFNTEMSLLNTEIRSRNPWFTLITGRSGSETERQVCKTSKLVRSVPEVIFRKLLINFTRLQNYSITKLFH